jgi:hypothetical protein
MSIPIISGVVVLLSLISVGLYYILLPHYRIKNGTYCSMPSWDNDANFGTLYLANVNNMNLEHLAKIQKGVLQGYGSKIAYKDGQWTGDPLPGHLLNKDTTFTLHRDRITMALDGGSFVELREEFCMYTLEISLIRFSQTKDGKKYREEKRNEDLTLVGDKLTLTTQYRDQFTCHLPSHGVPHACKEMAEVVVVKKEAEHRHTAPQVMAWVKDTKIYLSVASLVTKDEPLRPERRFCKIIAGVENGKEVVTQSVVLSVLNDVSHRTQRELYHG